MDGQQRLISGDNHIDLTYLPPDLWAKAYLPWRPLWVRAERAPSKVGRAGAISSTADQSRSVVSAVLADTGAASLAK